MPPTGVEPAHPPPEGGALSTELRGPNLLRRRPGVRKRVRLGKPAKGSRGAKIEFRGRRAVGRPSGAATRAATSGLLPGRGITLGGAPAVPGDDALSPGEPISEEIKVLRLDLVIKLVELLPPAAHR